MRYTEIDRRKRRGTNRPNGRWRPSSSSRRCDWCGRPGRRSGSAAEGQPPRHRRPRPWRLPSLSRAPMSCGSRATTPTVPRCHQARSSGPGRSRARRAATQPRPPWCAESSRSWDLS